jgi:uncharacterized protein
MQLIRAVLYASLALVAVMFASPTFAQKKPTDPANLATARALLATMGVDKQLETMIPLMMQSMRGVVLQQRPSAQKELDAALAALSEKFSARRQELVDQMADLYAERLPADDMKAMIAFFGSAAGKRFVSMQPELMREGAVIGQKWGAKIGQEVEVELRQELKKRGIDL